MDSPQLARIFIDNAFSAKFVSSVCVRGKLAVLARFENTPKAFANFSPGFEEREPWGPAHQRLSTLKGFHG
jgi:hypothetical protein